MTPKTRIITLAVAASLLLASLFISVASFAVSLSGPAVVEEVR